MLQFFELSIGSGAFSVRVPSREPEMGMRSTVLRPMTALGHSRRFDPALTTSGLRRGTDVARPTRYVASMRTSDGMDPPTSVYPQGMKSKALVLALGVLLMPIMANGQSPDAGIVGLTPFLLLLSQRDRAMAT